MQQDNKDDFSEFGGVVIGDAPKSDDFSEFGGVVIGDAPQKKNSVSTTSPIGGKVGASAIPSTGNEVAGLLGVKPIKPTQYATPTPLVEKAKTIVEPVGKNYGLRPDGTKKDVGYFGELKTKSGNSVTEYSFGTSDVNGKEMDIPSLVPTLTPQEKQYVLDRAEKDEPLGRDAIGNSIYKKAVDHAKQRLKEGKSPFYSSEEAKKVSTGDEVANLLGVRTAPKTLGELGQTTLPLAKDQKGSAQRVTALYEQKAKKTDDFIQEKKKLNELEAKLNQAKKDSEEYNVIVEDFNKAVESHNKKLAEREILANEIKAAEMGYREKYGEGNRLGYFYNSFLKGIGGMSSGVADAFFNVARNIPGVVAPSMEGEDITEFRKQIEPSIREGLKEKVGVGIVPEKEKKYNDEFWTSAIGGLTASVPAMIAPYGSGLIAQAYDAGLESINSIEEGQKLPETTKTIFASSVGLAQGMLEKYGLDKIFGKQSAAVSKKLAADVIQKALASGEKTITKESFEAALKQSVSGLKDKIVKAGGKIGEAVAVEFSTGAAQEASTIAAERLLNASQGKDVFEPTSWGETTGRILYAGSQEAVGGGLLGAASAPFSKTRNYIAEKVADAKTQEDYQALRKEFTENVSPEQADAANKIIDYYANVNSKIPDNVPNRKEVIEKVVERDDIKEEIARKQQELEQVDEAFRPKIQEEIDALNGRVAELNEEIANPVIAQEAVVEEQPSQPIITKNTTPTDEKYGTIDRGDGKGVIDLTRAEYEAEIAKQQPAQAFEEIPEISEEKKSLESEILSEEEFINKTKNNRNFFRKILDKIGGVSYDKYLKNAKEKLALLEKNPLAYFEKELNAEIEWGKKDPSDINEGLIEYYKGAIEKLKNQQQKQPTAEEVVVDESPAFETDQTEAAQPIELSVGEEAITPQEEQPTQQGEENVNPALNDVESKAKALELKNEGKADTPTKENVTERLSINNPFYKKVEDALVKLGLIEKYNAQTKTGDVVGGYVQETSDGGFSAGKMLFSKNGEISYLDGNGNKVSFDKNGNVISENTKQVAQQAKKTEIEATKLSITSLEKTRDSEAFKYKEATETDILGNKKKVKRLKTPQELKESTDKINNAIDKAKARLVELENSESPVESTAKALEKEFNKGSVWLPSVEMNVGDNPAKKISEAYHADKAAEKETELTKAVEKLLTTNTNQNEQKTKIGERGTLQENDQQVGEGGQVQGISEENRRISGDESLRQSQDAEDGTGGQEENVTEQGGVTAPVTEEKIEATATQANIKPKNLRDLYNVNRTLFGQNKVRSLANAVIMDKMIGAMAKRAGVIKAEMYERLEFRKASEEELPQGVKMQVDAWHGSPYQFDKFTTEKIGTGEGAQAFGWGLYFTDLESIARGYAQNLATLNIKTTTQQISDAVKKFNIKNGLPSNYNYSILADVLVSNNMNIDKAIDFYNKSIQKRTEDYNNPENKFRAGYLLESIKDEQSELKTLIGLKENNTSIKPPERLLYKVSLHNGKKPSEYTWLEWDKPLTKEQRNIIIKAIEDKDFKTRTAYGNPLEVVDTLGTTGKQVYESLAFEFGQKQASLLLLENGIDGVKYPAESIARAATSDTARGFNYVVFDENAVSIEEVIKFQKDANKARGAAMVNIDGTAIIYAITDPNVSTPLHELAHVFEHYLKDYERETIIRNAKTNGWTTETSEYFARGFEKYLADGVAPSAEMKRIFERFKEWLTEIYNGVTGSEINIPLNDEMRAIYAKMLGEEEVAKTQPNETKTEQEKPLLEGVRNGGNEAQVGQESAELRAEAKNQEEVKATIADAVAKFYAIEGKGSQKREAAKAYRQTLEKMPTVKNIFDNIKPIFAQLEREGIITKSKECP